ncbi:MAG: (d)CMP kinase [Chloroflexi bacterium]|nr:(d)CMP kinase [Chloroflexota bacterium]MQC26031.1 (d)CMP kinase [Chloroflexota bacterium]
MTKALAIAIDGPAASGKSTLAQSLAEHFEYLYFDTGALYRAVTLAALQRNVEINDEQSVTKLALEVSIDLVPPTQQDSRQYDVLIDEKDCTWEIRSAEVDAHVSQVSAYPGVRSALKDQQQRIGRRGGVVMAGRDIGTVVLPEADLKIYLDASVEERALRRHAELEARGQQADYAQVEQSMRIRDEIDANRAIAPLRPADDAIVLKSDGKQAKDVLAIAIKLVEAKIEELS